MRLRYIFYIGFLLAVISGCAKPPTVEMDNARDAVFRAESDADAVQYGASSLARARDALNRMQTEADSKRYDSAKAYAAEAITAAERAIADGWAGADRARTEAASMISALGPEIDETSRNVSAAHYSELDLDYDALEKDLIDAYIQTDRAESDYAEGRYQDSIDNAMDVRSSLADINGKISDAVPRSKS